MSERAERCQFCKWWGAHREEKRESAHYRTYDCRRHSPVFHEIRDHANYIRAQNFPQTGSDDWCGEFEQVAKAVEVTS